MSPTPPIQHRFCPHLGLQADPASMFTEAAEEHRCYVTDRGRQIDLGHQVLYCLTSKFETCPRFVAPAEPAKTEAADERSFVFRPDLDSLPTTDDIVLPPTSRLPYWLAEILERVSVLQVLAWGLVAVVVVVAIYGYLTMRRSLAGTAPPAVPAAVVVTPTSLSVVLTSPVGTPAPAPGEVVPVAASTPVRTSPTATLPAGWFQVVLYPAGNAVGWVASNDPLNHFGDRNLLVGVFEGHTYYGALQFVLSSIQPGSRIEAATLELTGLSAEHLGADGTWSLRLLSPDADQNWAAATYDQIHAAPVLDTMSPVLEPQDLEMRQANAFSFTPAQLAELERRLESGFVSFRLDGPTQGADNLFTWDTGYGGGFGMRPVLRIVYQPPPTATPVVVDAIPVTPTPANAVTAAALAATATYEATAIGTPTPWPTNMVTATPVLVVTNTPVPGNTATAAWMDAVATAEAFLHGTPTPLPTGVWTATPSPTFVIVTSTPTPENVFTVVWLAATATRMAATTGTYTPVPENWVTPIVVMATPRPADAATATYQSAVATAEALAFGTPTATPVNVWTVTPTSIWVLLDGELPTPRPTSTPTATPQPVPSGLVGKIAFLSDRTGDEEPLVYVINPDGTGLALLTDRVHYEAALARDVYSADQRFRVFVKDAIIDTGDVNDFGTVTPIQLRVPSLFVFDYDYKVEAQISHFGSGIAYDPVWSPTAAQVAFVSDDSGNDEIWVMNADGGGARQLTRDDYGWWDKHPSWSPDGSKIVFWSNRTGNRQIWVMDAGGGNLYSLSRTGYDDWDPVWIKYTDPARDPALVD